MAPPTQNRRDFLRAAGGLAVVGLCTPARAIESAWRSSWPGDDGPSRIAVFFEEGFPGVGHFNLDRRALSGELLQAGASGVDFFGESDLASGLDNATHRLFVNPYGSAFPEAAWEPILKFLSAGGNLLNLGGVPFSVAVGRGRDGVPVKGIARTTFHRELGIIQSVTVPTVSALRYEDFSMPSGPQTLSGLVEVEGVHELTVRFTSTRDYPDEDGTSGQRDAEIHAEVGGFDTRGDMLVAPVVRIERLLGRFAGGKWILANFSGRLKAGAVREMARRAFGPVVRVTVEPSFATYFPGETPAFTLRAPDPARLFSGQLKGAWSVGLSDPNGTEIFKTKLGSDDLAGFPGGQFVLPGKIARTLTPGLYTVRATFSPGRTDLSGSGAVWAANGFWVMDQKLLSSGTGLRAGADYLYRNGKTFPVVGTSYMSEGVQRKFLFEPNPALWEKDFREMKRSGVNMIRTGIWTGWKNIMLDAGRLNESPLRALDAFLLTAAKYELPVIFTFFAFLPESWGGENPYLDPRSVQAQTIFLSTISRRYADAPGVIWDLINEPSFCSADHLWQCRPNYDAHELAAWSDRFVASDAAQGEHGRSERFRLSGGGTPPVPLPEDFTDRNIIGDSKPLLAAEYRMFAQERFRRWVETMASTLRQGGGTTHLLTVGQDEGGTADRPGPHFFAGELDFTSMHNWWYNDDLLWDSVMTSVPGKANLIGETGVMVYETADGRPWRTEDEVRDLLEKKLAISFASGGAGFINWLWNSNPYMDSDNEAGIGLKRADGTLKPGYDSVRRFARFFSDHADLMTGREEEQVVMVIPHSGLFSNRNTATEATRNCVRAMEYHCGVAIRGISEFDLELLADPPPLMVLPSPVIFDAGAWPRVKSLVDRGSTLVLSGPFDEDRFFLPTGRMVELGLSPRTEPVNPEELLRIDSRELRAGFRGEKLQRVRKSVTEGRSVPSVSVIGSGNGRIVFSPIPVELSDSIETVAAFYRYAISLAGMSTRIRVANPDPSVLVRTIAFSGSLMVAFIPEGGVAREIDITLTESSTSYTVRVPARRPLVHFYDRTDGTLIAALGSPEYTP